MKHSICSLFLFVTIGVSAQTPISSYYITNTAASVTTNSANGWGEDYPSNTTYNNHYGQTGAGSGIERVITGFAVGGTLYKKIPISGGKPANQVRIITPPGEPQTYTNAFFENTTTSGNNLYFEPGYADGLENILNSFSSNRGAENIFVNNGSTSSNIERIDFIISAGVTCNSTTGQGFLINSRNGDDQFKIAAITDINEFGEITVGNLITVSSSSWGRVGPSITSTVFSKNLLLPDVNLRPRKNIAAQTISGVFISFGDLGLASGAIIYGFAVYPNDVLPDDDLTNMKTTPTNTNHTNGGLDILAGSGYYVQTTILPVTNLQLKGEKKYNDIQLEWSVDYEVDNFVFEVQRSTNTNTWKTIGVVAAGAQRAANKYLFIDYNATSGNNFYRLKQIDIDHNFSYSKVLQIKSSSEKEVTSFFPNPAKNKAFLTISNSSQTPESIKILNIAGHIVAELKTRDQIQNNILSLDVSSYANGIYHVQLINKTGSVDTYRLIVKH